MYRNVNLKRPEITFNILAVAGTMLVLHQTILPQTFNSATRVQLLMNFSFNRRTMGELSKGPSRRVRPEPEIQKRRKMSGAILTASCELTFKFSLEKIGVGIFYNRFEINRDLLQPSEIVKTTSLKNVRDRSGRLRGESQMHLT